ncbi:MAG TPA: UDP-N-acetylmuramate dehydrogenase [Bacteroidales bacterium]|nr:UDP-N-acetylmuramate dehydrogenase [Bacteroidales bacterium]HQI71117.1 UDP-N-acetylmuramate dehydrogenase [Bacteroidales bacterium]
MQIFEHFDLKNFNTFGIAAYARQFTEIRCQDDYAELIGFYQETKLPLLPLGCGSNILFTKNYEGLVARINSKGIRKIAEDDNTATIDVAAGELWEDLIKYCIKEQLCGLENLSGIPGQAGSSPIQNIGAYGVEVKSCIKEVVALSIENGEKLRFSNADCRFGYRDSIFKRELKGKVIITNVIFSLSKKTQFTLEYGGVAEEVKRISAEPDLAAVSKAICTIRDKKIPNPKDIGSAGSFFKNPVIENEPFEHIIARYPDMPHYPAAANRHKLAAAWLIDRCGWKGYRQGDAGVNDKQPLILVNYGQAGGDEIIQLAHQIQDSVYEKFGIYLETEVNIL